MIVLQLGTNVGNRLNNLQTTIELLQKRGVVINKTSSIYETEPWGFSTQPNFFNIILVISFKNSPLELFHITQEIEIIIGREKKEKWRERIIDIDILFFNSLVYSSVDLIIPHPQIQNRKFVLEPMAEIIPNFIHPIFNQTIKKLFKDCKDTLTCTKTNLSLYDMV